MNKKFLIKKMNEPGYRFIITIDSSNHKIILRTYNINYVEYKICKAIYYEKIYNTKANML